MTNLDPSEEQASGRMSAGQWFILALLVLLNLVVVGLLILAITGRLSV